MPKAAVRYIGPWRPATKEDLVASLGPAARVNTPPIRLRESHHNIIYLAALGYTNIEIAAQTGYSRERVGQILASPLAAARLEALRAQADQRIIDLRTGEAELDLRTRLVAKQQRLDFMLEQEEKNEYLPVKDYNQIISDLEDRFGTPRKSTNVSLHANFASSLEEAIERSNAVEAVKGATLPEAPK